LKGCHESEISAKGKEFARHILPALLKPEGMQRLRWHQQQNHRCILVSATLDSFLAPWSQQVGFNDLICSKLAADERHVISGKLEGLNCWGAEKVRRLELLLGPRAAYTLYAYGDSRGDRELLAFADHAFYRTFEERQVSP